MSQEKKWKEEFKQVLDSIDSTGDFCVGKRIAVPALCPKITIVGMEDERLAFPLCPTQAEKIRAVAQKAPFGKDMDTVVKEDVRKAWQIDSSNVHFDDRASWEQVLQPVVQDCAECLGIKPRTKFKVQANLSKMLLCEQGGHFKQHRDTEKEPGVFGTLVIQLPAKHSGGSLVIEHKGERRKFNFSSKSQDGFFVTAFYADCEQELQEVTEGWRLCLVYNLVMTNQPRSQLGSPPTADHLSARTQALRQLAAQWSCPNPSVTGAAQGYVLEHRYTETNLRFTNLKGRDRDVVDTLRFARDKEGRPLFLVCLLLLEKREFGPLYFDGRMKEVHDSSTSTYLWIGQDDKMINNFELDFGLEDCLLTDRRYLFRADPDKEEIEGYNGNAVPTIEYWYYRGVVAFWPRARNIEISTKAGLPFVVSCLTSAHSSDVPAMASAIVDLLEQKKGEVDSRTLKALFRAKDPALMTRAFKTMSSIKNTSLATEMVAIMNAFLEDRLNTAALEVLRRTLVISQYSSGGIAIAAHFLKLLELIGLESLVPSARDVIISRAMSAADNILKSKEAATEIAKIAFQSSSFALFIDLVISKAGKATLGSILAVLMEMEGANCKPEVARLASHRVKQLRKSTKHGAPTFSWKQPKAQFFGSQATAVQAFLFSEEKSKTFYDFNGIDHARNWSYKYFGRSSTGYSASTSSGGCGKSAYVTVTKTKEAYQLSLGQYNADKEELEGIINKFGAENLDAIETTCNKRTSRLPEGQETTKRSKQ